MSKRALKKKSRSKAVVPALGITGLSLSLASGAAASTGEATTTVQSTSQPHELFLGEEEIFDVSLSTFYVFDKENAGATPLAQQLKLAARGGGCGRCGGCGGRCGGCGGVHVGCGGCHVACRSCRCGFFRGCGGCGCGGCGGCGGGCGTCWIWTPLGWINTCWGESTPAAKVASVASEPIPQIAQAEEKR